VKQTLLAMAALAALSVATSEAKTIQAPPTEVYYDTGCRNVVTYHVTQSGEVVTEHSRTCY
jgi:hypothetical protein